MTGIEKIIKKIECDTNTECESIISTARDTAQSIIKNANSEAAQKAEQIVENAHIECRTISDRAKSTAAINDRRITLSYKQKAVSDMIQSAVEYLKSLPTDEYFELIYKMLEKNTTSDNGTIYFNPADLSRLPSDFTAKAGSVSSGKITLSDEPISIDSGFVLKYGDIEQNCSFSAVVHSNIEKISDAVTHLLF